MMMALLAMAMMTLMLMSRFTVGVVVKSFVMEREELRNVNVGSNVQVEQVIVVVLSLDDVIAVDMEEETVTHEGCSSEIDVIYVEEVVEENAVLKRQDLSNLNSMMDM